MKLRVFVAKTEVENPPITRIQLFRSNTKQAKILEQGSTTVKYQHNIKQDEDIIHNNTYTVVAS